MGAIREKMKADLDLRRFAESTKKEYLRRAQNFVAHYRRPPTELGPAETHAFFTHLVQEKKSARRPITCMSRRSSSSTPRRSAGRR
jgi:hypothetical protein